jgi:hypothetical protein
LHLLVPLYGYLTFRDFLLILLHANTTLTA